DLAGRLRAVGLRRRRDHRVWRRPAAPSAAGAGSRQTGAAQGRPRRPRGARGGSVVSTAANVFRTSQLPENPGRCGCVALLRPCTGRPRREAPTTPDITGSGGGFAGLPAARRLQRLAPTLKVAVLEAGVVGDGPAGRNSGFIIDLPHEVSSEDYGGD